VFIPEKVNLKHLLAEEKKKWTLQQKGCLANSDAARIVVLAESTRRTGFSPVT
jgi:hypothetical protein